MKKYLLKIKVFLVVLLCAVTGIVFFWLSDEGRFDSYDMVAWAADGDPFSLKGNESTWRQYLPVAISDWFKRDYGTEDGHFERLHLPEQQEEKLKGIFSSINPLDDGVSGDPPPFIGTFGTFLVTIDGEHYLLDLYYSGPVPGGHYDSKNLSIKKVLITRQGYPVAPADENVRYFSSPDLHGRLERFLQELPESSDARAEYDESRASMKSMVDAFNRSSLNTEAVSSEEQGRVGED